MSNCDVQSAMSMFVWAETTKVDLLWMAKASKAVEAQPSLNLIGTRVGATVYRYVLCTAWTMDVTPPQDSGGGVTLRELEMHNVTCGPSLACWGSGRKRKRGRKRDEE